jgi:hypothetical protein
MTTICIAVYESYLSTPYCILYLPKALLTIQTWKKENLDPDVIFPSLSHSFSIWQRNLPTKLSKILNQHINCTQRTKGMKDGQEMANVFEKGHTGLIFHAEH